MHGPLFKLLARHATIICASESRYTFVTSSSSTIPSKLDPTMKRKLNDVDAPEAPSENASQPRPEVSFRSLGLDERLVKAAAHQKFHTPTAVQAQAIPLILRGEHLLARARTG